MVAVCRAPIAVNLPLLPERLDEREDPVAHRLKHLLRRGLFESRPAEIVPLGGEDRILDRLAGAGSLGFFERVQLVESLDEEQVGELLDDRERIRDAAGPHRVPDAVHFGFEFAGDHDLSFNPACSVAYAAPPAACVHATTPLRAAGPGQRRYEAVRQCTNRPREGLDHAGGVLAGQTHQEHEPRLPLNQRLRCVSCGRPDNMSPSQCPGTARSSTSAGRSRVETASMMPPPCCSGSARFDRRRRRCAMSAFFSTPRLCTNRLT